MNETAATLNRLGYRADLAIDKLVAPLATGIAAAVRQHAFTDHTGKSVITPFGYALVMKAVDEQLRSVYGTHRGDIRAPMYHVLTTAATAAHRAPVEATVREIKARLKGEPALVKALEGKR